MMSPGGGSHVRPGYGAGRERSYEDSPLSFVAGGHSGVGTGANSSPMLGAYPMTPRTPGARSQATAPSTPGTDNTYSRRPPMHRQQTMTASQVRRGLVARATQDSTLAVIPAEAFRRLTKKFPKASAHIVQVILTRFSRVTFNAAHKYLGLTTEVLRTEKAINELACHPLPASFYEGGGMHNLRNKFAPDDGEAVETEDDTMTSASTVGLDSSSTIGLDSEDDYFGSNIGSWRDSPVALNPTTPGPSSSRRHGRSRSRGSTFDSRTGPVIRGASVAPSTSLTKSMSGKALSHMAVMAGDLHSSTSSAIDNTIDTYRPRSRATPKTPGLPISVPPLPTPIREAARLPPQRDASTGSETTSALPAAQADINLRDEVMACIAKSIGLLQPPISDTPSGDASPVLVPFDTRSQSVTSNAVADDGSSVTGTASILGNHPYATGLDNEVEILCFAAGSTLVRAGERNAGKVLLIGYFDDGLMTGLLGKPGLFYVIDGFLDVSLPVEEHVNPNTASSSNGAPVRTGSRQSISQPKSKASVTQGVRWGEGPQSAKVKNGTSSHATKGVLHTKVSKHLFTVKPGGIAGYLASLSGTPSYVEIKAKVDTYVGFLPHHAMERLIERRPIVLLTLSKRLISLLSPLVLHIDSSLDWMQVNAGQVLWRPGDPSDSFYIVINGRLRALAEKEDGGVIGEYGQGDTVGELDVITRSNRTSTLHAIRDTELARMPQTLFNAISVRLLRMVASRVRNLAQPANPASSKVRTTVVNNNNFNLKTVAILPAARNVPVSAFAKKLHSALEEIGASTVYLNQASMMNHVGRHAFTRMGKLKVAGWLADQEQRYRIVLYVADSPVSAPWTQTCIRQADYIMIVGMGDDPSIGEYERLLLTTKTTARKELVLLHPDRSVPQGSTREWLKIRPWVHAYHHVELPGIVKQTAHPAPEDPAAVKAFKDIKNIVQTEIKKYRGYTATPHSRRPDHLSDFARLARRICGKSIGLVLGGGGARGVAHLGILRALEERNIPIDHIGGTSIGALVGGLYAREANVIQCSARVKAFGSRMGNIWRLLSDVTWPVVAYTTGHEFNRGIFKAFGALHIEDMWLPFFCNSTNILTSQMDIHDTGYAWRYVRASMTLVGLLPPICDNGNMLVDGGYLDNLPVSTMRSMGPNTIIAVDVGSLDDNSPRNFGDTVSGIWIAINRWNPFSSVRYIPPITEIQSRLAYVSSITSLEEAKNTPGCYYIQPPVQGYGTLQFNKYDELVDIGYKAALELIDKWKEEGRLPSGYEDDFRMVDKLSKKRKGRSLRRNSV
ncbi:phosphatidylcholine and lysophosphatidylcholine phospholipase [Tulasnella sp. 408]|nr:phosphatidylcholine and lysophosphatidylcholine phospholipase [Tulasnella sp. 408]